MPDHAIPYHNTRIRAHAGQSQRLPYTPPMVLFSLAGEMSMLPSGTLCASRTGAGDRRKNVNAVGVPPDGAVLRVLLFVAVGVRCRERFLILQPHQFEITLSHGRLQLLAIVVCLPPLKRDRNVDVVGQNLTVPVEVKQRPAIQLVRDAQLSVENLCQFCEDAPPFQGVRCSRLFGAVVRW